MLNTACDGRYGQIRRKPQEAIESHARAARESRVQLRPELWQMVTGLTKGIIRVVLTTFDHATLPNKPQSQPNLQIVYSKV